VAEYQRALQSTWKRSIDSPLTKSPRCCEAPPPVYSSLQSGVTFRQFSPLTTDDVVDAVRRLPDKSSAADPIPTNVLKQIIDLIAPYVVELFNRSLATGPFHVGFKDAFITPDVKKPGLDDSDVSSYRPISKSVCVVLSSSSALLSVSSWRICRRLTSYYLYSLDSGQATLLKLLWIVVI